MGTWVWTEPNIDVDHDAFNTHTCLLHPRLRLTCYMYTVFDVVFELIFDEFTGSWKYEV